MLIGLIKVQSKMMLRIPDERFIESGDSNFGIGFHEANFNRPREVGVKLKAGF